MYGFLPTEKLFPGVPINYCISVLNVVPTELAFFNKCHYCVLTSLFLRMKDMWMKDMWMKDMWMKDMCRLCRNNDVRTQYFSYTYCIISNRTVIRIV